MSKKTIKQYSREPLTTNHLAQLQVIAGRYAAVKNYVSSRYSGPKSLPLLRFPRQTIRNELDHSDLPVTFGLSTRYWHLAMDEAVSGIKTEWSNTKNRVRSAVRNNPNLTDSEKHYINFVLRWDEILSAILCHQPFEAPDKLPDIGERVHAIHNLIRRYIRRYKGSIPLSRKKRSFMIDASMYRYCEDPQGVSIAIAGLVAGQRMVLPLTDRNRHTGILRVVIRDNGQIEIHKCKTIRNAKLEKKPKSRESILAIDKGYTSLFATSSDREYGTELGILLSAETDWLNDINRKRNRIWAQINALEQAGELEKANRIRKNNYGRIKYNRQKHRQEEQLQSLINGAIRELIKTEQPDRVIVEQLTFQTWFNKMNKKTKRKLARWVKGIIQKRLEYICELYGIPVVLVNPAYTSQICHQCGSFGKRNNKTFTCPHCGTMDADINAAHNIKNRYFDKEITLFTPHQQVKTILTARQKPAA